LIVLKKIQAETAGHEQTLHPTKTLGSLKCTNSSQFFHNVKQLRTAMIACCLCSSGSSYTGFLCIRAIVFISPNKYDTTCNRLFEG